jgi:hypothetical protein
MALYDSLREYGAEYLIGHILHSDSAILEVISVLAIGNAMIVYDLNTTTFDPLVLKVPRADVGTAEHERVANHYRWAIEMYEHANGRLAETIEIEIEGVPCFLQQKVTPLS